MTPRPVEVTPENEALFARLDELETQIRLLYVLIVWLARKEAC